MQLPHNPQTTQRKNFCCYKFYEEEFTVKSSEFTVLAMTTIMNVWKQTDLKNWKIYFHIIPQDKQKNDMIRKAFKTWKDTGICLEFIQTNDPKLAHIKIIYQKGVNQDYSMVGSDNINRKISKNHTMRLSFREKDDKQNFATALHEIGHAIGLQHQHQNPFSKIQWNKDQVLKQFNISQQQARQNIFSPASQQSQSYGTSIDRNSIMVYNFSNKCFISPKQLAEKGTQRSQNLTNKDISFIKSLYPDEEEVFTPIKYNNQLELKAENAPVSIFVYFENPTSHLINVQNVTIPKILQKQTKKLIAPENLKWNSTSMWCFTGKDRCVGLVQYRCQICDDILSIRWNLSANQNILSLPELKDYEKGITTKSSKTNHFFSVTQSPKSTKNHKIVRIQCKCVQKPKNKVRQPYHNYEIHN